VFKSSIMYNARGEKCEMRSYTIEELDSIDQIMLRDGQHPQDGPPPWVTALSDPTDVTEDLRALGVIGFYIFAPDFQAKHAAQRSGWVVLAECARVVPELHLRAVVKFGVLNSRVDMPYWGENGEVQLARLGTNTEHPKPSRRSNPYPKGSKEWLAERQEARRAASRKYQEKIRKTIKAVQEGGTP
jgi:hypothetical protein